MKPRVDHIRLFLALILPGELQKRLQALQDELASEDWQIGWTSPQDLHLTLHFLGETPRNLLADLHHDLGAVAHARRPFDVSVGGLDAFPSLEDPRILWTGIHDPADRIGKLFRATHVVLRAYGNFELRSDFVPHLTLGRVQSLSAAWQPQRIQGLLPQWKKLGVLPVDAMRLMSSHSEHGMTRYETVEAYQFNAGR